MSTLLIDTTDVNEAVSEEAALPPGDYEVRFYSPNPVSRDVEQDIFDHLYNSGVDVRGVYQRKTDGLWYIGVIYEKPAPYEAVAALPVAVIPLIAFGFIATLIGIGIFRVENIAKSLGQLALILLGGTIILVALLRKPIERVTEVYARGR